MAGTSFNSNLGLPLNPETDSVELYNAVAPLYSAMRILAGNLDAATGTVLVTPEEYSDQTDNSLMISNFCRIYRKFGENVYGGSTVRILDIGGEALAYNGTDGTVCGYCPADVKTGEWGVIVLQGLVRIGGLAIGSVYTAHPANAGQFSLLGTQKLMRAIGPESAYFRPDY